MVSAKCLKTSSPSPLRFLAALMPPWAQTECERLTGTMEKRSTLPPASAILMTAARPARPPPTTMILGVAAAISYLGGLGQKKNAKYAKVAQRSRGLLRPDGTGWWNCGCGQGDAGGLSGHYVFGGVGVFIDDGPDADEAHEAEGCAAEAADVAEALAGLFAGGDAPLGGEEPDAVGEVPGGSDHGDDVDGEHPGVGELDLNFGEGCAGVLGERDAAEALPPYVLDDVEEGDDAGDALRDVHQDGGPA